MNQEQKLLLELLSASINNKNISPSNIDESTWEKVFEESKSQAVALMAFDSLSTTVNAVPDEVYRNWLKYVGAVIKSNAKVAQEQNYLVELLEKNHFPFVIIKGEASASYYSKPSLRALGDVDFLVLESDVEQIKNLLANNGYLVEQENHICHITYLRNGVQLEMHFEVAGVPNGVLGDLVRSFLENAVNDFAIKKINQKSFKAPNDVNHALINLLHIQHHFVSEGIGLRHLCDWSCFIENTYNCVFWQLELLPFLKEIGLFDFTMALTQTACTYLSIKEPSWLHKTEENIIDDIIDDIFSGGNFGNKDEMKAKSGIFISNHGKDGTKHGKIYNLTNALKTAINSKYPISKKYPVLLLFFFPYSILRQIILILFKKRKNILKAIPLANKRKELYDKLNIFEV